MKYKIIASCLVVLVSAFSFAQGDAQVAHTGHSQQTMPGLTTNLQTTTVGSTNWTSEMTVPAGTATSWLLSYKNDTALQIPKVMLRASMPMNHTLVPGSVMLFDSNFPAGFVLPDSGLFNEGIDVGAVNAGINGFIRYRTVLKANTPCGITSTASAYIEANNTSAMHEAWVSTPACAVEVSGSTSTANPPITNAAQTDHGTTHTVTSATAVTSTQAQVVPAVEVHTNDHTSSQATPTQTSTQTPTQKTPVTQEVTTVAHATHTTSATTAPAAATPPPVTQTPTSHATHTTSPAVAGATTSNTNHTTATSTHDSHSTTLPEAGGNPFWLILWTLASGYIAHLLYTQKKLYAAQRG